MDIPKSTKIFKEVDNKKVIAISYSQLNMFLQCPQKWKKSYWDGIVFDGKFEALEYGSCIHETYEYYAKNKAIGKTLELAEIQESFNQNFNEKEIPFSTEEEKTKAILDGSKAIERLTTNGGYIESLINKSTILGIEQEFILPINHVSDLNEDIFDCVYIFGAIDLILQKENEDIILIDHKSGKNKFVKSKLLEDWQFPIYGMYIKEKYGKLPKRCFYNFTRLGDFQEVKLDEEGITQTKKLIKNTVTKMYNGKKYECKPSPLCYWCEFSKTKHDMCESSSEWTPADKKGAK